MIAVVKKLLVIRKNRVVVSSLGRSRNLAAVKRPISHREIERKVR